MTDLFPVESSTLNEVRMHARSASWHRTMHARLVFGREANKHKVSAYIADGRLQRALGWARDEDIDPAIVQVAVMEGEAAGMDDADAALRMAS